MITISTNQRQLSIRPPAVAGSFYPQNASELNALLEDYLTNSDVDITPPKAIIAPHAGYIYSGKIAANVYKNIEKLKTQITRVVLLGPAHRVYVEGIALPSNTHFATPLGNVPIDTDVVEELEHHSYVQFSDAAHEQEHSLEVQLPFLQKVLNDFTLIPLLIGNAAPDQVATILKELWGGDE
ncbi:MAG: AmmeMemoRadiSam system protein B, partial [Gammaproteobacteria bacterium]